MPSLYVEILDLKRVFFDKLPAAFDVFAHQDAEQTFGFAGFFERDAEQGPLVRVERGFPKLFALHLAEAIETADLDALFAQAVDLLGDGGRMIAVGIAAGRTTAPVEITRLVRRGLRIVGSYGARTRADMPEILRLAERGTFRLETLVTRRYALSEAEDAYQALNRGEIAGRAVVMP